MFGKAEGSVQGAVEWLRLGVESLGAVVIGPGILMALFAILRRPPLNFFLSREMKEEQKMAAAHTQSTIEQRAR